MQDPQPSNITGEKVQQHVFKHEVDWGHIIIGIVVLFAVWYTDPLSKLGDDDEADVDLGLN